jgi:hypothetical protein
MCVYVDIYYIVYLTTMSLAQVDGVVNFIEDSQLCL